MNRPRCDDRAETPAKRRLYDRLRDNLVVPNSSGSSGMRDIISALAGPDDSLDAAASRWTGAACRKKGSLSLAWPMSSRRLMSCRRLCLGPIGFLDDLFIVAACLSRLLNHVHPDVVRTHWSGQGDALEVIQNTTNWFRARNEAASLQI